MPSTALWTAALLNLQQQAVAGIYEGIKARMAEGCAGNGDPVGADVRSWQVTSTRPARAGPQGGRFLQTFANGIAAEQYLKFADDGFTMPAGSVRAKESFKVKNGNAVPGPRFIRTKLAGGGAPVAGGWLYAALLPNGAGMKVRQSFCAGCRMDWEAPDSLACPLEDVRLSSQ
ncbi:recombinase [Leisingera methylohalidivorans]|uniref:recombinase n=1 Tax=Leisingera methylohalidivorans TaxID=133924 RepID=UPI0004187E05|nr:recombinase [Leisingera methylohalidivorans]